MPGCPPGIHFSLTDCGYQPTCPPFHCNQINCHKSLNRANAITSKVYKQTHIYSCVRSKRGESNECKRVGRPPGREVVKLAPVCYALLLSVFYCCWCCWCCNRCCYCLHQFITSTVGHLTAFKFIAFSICTQHTRTQMHTHTNISVIQLLNHFILMQAFTIYKTKTKTTKKK